jgi:hypothetical protein
MVRRVQRGRYGAEALTEAEIQKLETSPETAAGHINHDCNSCRCAARDQRAALEPLLSDLQHTLVHGHAATLRPDVDSYDVAIAIHADGTPCRCAGRARATFEPLLRDVLHVALAHGHAITITPDPDSYDIVIEIHRERARDGVDQARRDVSVDMAAVMRAIR